MTIDFEKDQQDAMKKDMKDIVKIHSLADQVERLEVDLEDNNYEKLQESLEIEKKERKNRYKKI